MNIKDILNELLGLGLEQLDGWVKTNLSALEKLGKDGIQLANILKEAFTGYMKGKFSKKQYDDITDNVWKAAKQKALAKGYDNLISNQELLKNSLNHLVNVGSMLLGKLGG